MSRRSKTQEHKALIAASVIVDGELCVTLKYVKNKINELIKDDPSSNFEKVFNELKRMGDKMTPPVLVIPCSYCAKMIGVKKCAKCPRSTEIRYCSRECQVAAWPSHKAFHKVVIDVE